MKNPEFNSAVMSLNIRYRDRFGVIPCIMDFSYTREEYQEAMGMAVKNGKSLEDVLAVRECLNKENFTLFTYESV